MTRLEVQSLLESILGSRNVYFQPPESISMRYPAIVYYLDTIINTNADDLTYLYNKRYQIIAISPDPDDKIVDDLTVLPLCSFIRGYRADNLNHWVFSLYT